MNTRTCNTKRRWNLQISLATLFYVVTACAFLSWLTNLIGFIVVAGILIGLVTSIPCGAIIGLLRGNVRAATIAGAVGGMIGVAVFIATIVDQANRFGEMERLRGYSLQTFVFYLPFLLRFAVAALAGAVPFASVGAVHKRDGFQVVAFPALACGGTTFLGCLMYFAYGVWLRGGFPQPPLPWPIAYAFFLVPTVIGAAIIGLLAGLSWLIARSTWHAIVDRRSRCVE